MLRTPSLLLIVLFAVLNANAQNNVAPKPLYRDPVFDGAADPVVIWNSRVKEWWMFYTNRRANVRDLSGFQLICDRDRPTRIRLIES